MAAKTSKTEEPSASRQTGPAGLGDPMTAGSALAQAWMAMGAESVRFVWDRLQTDIKTQQAMLACTTLEEMQKIQAEFFAAAQKQYAAEAGKMLDLMRKATVPGLATSTGARRYDDVPL